MKTMKTKIIISICFFLSAEVVVNAQAPSWLWAKSAGGPSGELGQSIATDAAGNVYVTGNFYSTSITFDTITLTTAGSLDMYIVKYGPSGNVKWAKRAGGSGDEYSQGVAVDENGNVCVTGYFSSTSITFGSTSLTNAQSGINDIFLVKYDSLGNVLWAKREGRFGDDQGLGVATGPGGFVYITGQYNSAWFTVGSFTLNNASTAWDFFLIMYDPLGNVVAAKGVGGTLGETGLGVATDAFGNAFVTGYFSSSTVTFGSITLTNANNNTDIFVVKYDNSLNVLYAKRAGDLGIEDGQGIAIDASGNAFVTGVFGSSSITFGTTTLTNNGSTNSYDIYVVKYDPYLNPVWAKSAGGTADDRGRGIATDTYGNIYATGVFKSASISFGSNTVTNAGVNENIFVSMYDASGNSLWAKSAGGTSQDEAYGIATDANENIFITGYFTNATIAFGTTTLINAGFGGDIYTAKLAPNTLGIINENQQTEINIFPNPSNGIFTLNSEIGKGEISIYNLLGEIVFQSTINNPASTIDLSNQANGIYFVNVKTEKGSYTQKISID